MNLNFIPINGKSPFFEYEAFEISARQILQNTCQDATIILFNNFPVLLTTEATIDLILIIALKDVKGNYFRVKKEEKWIYLHNLIIPINFVTNLQNETIVVDEEGVINVGDETFDYTDEIQSIKFSLLDYLVRKCDFIKEQLFITPLIFINNKQKITQDNFLISEKFDFSSIVDYLRNSSQAIFVSYKNWKNEIGYSILPADIEAINSKASEDSKFGFLTKKKIDRISKQLSNEKAIFNDINQNLIIVHGKAGTGKSSELLLLMMRCISSGKNTLFLTYNKILIYDIARTTKAFINIQIRNNTQKNKIGQSQVITLHSFFYRLSKAIGVLHVLTDERKKDLILNLDLRVDRIKNSLIDYIKNGNTISNYSDIEKTKEFIQNNKQFDIPTIEVGIDLLNYQRNKGGFYITNIDVVVKAFCNYKIDLVNNIDVKEVFLSDYYGVLENTLLLLKNSTEYFKKYDIENKFELLEVVLKLNEKHIKVDEESILLDEKNFIKKINKIVGGKKMKRTLLIDEAQDCDPREKEILIFIYGSNNIIVSSGGKEQLIRHTELCNWNISNSRKMNVKKYYTGSKSFRIKKSILKFCNFIAEKFKIELKLDHLQTEDDGELIFDFRKDISNENVNQVFSNLTYKGKVNNCTEYESLLVLIDSHSKIEKMKNGERRIRNNNEIKGRINEYGNIEDSIAINKIEWKYKLTLETENKLMFWDGTHNDKTQMAVPYPNETRLIYYDSCRGLEAWCVACFNIDSLFNQKKDEPDAEKFLINKDEQNSLMQDLFILSNEERKNMFAGTWVLMAITRAIDSLYLKFDNPNSELSKIAKEYATLNPTNVKVYE
jgi:hypothetical protein